MVIFLLRHADRSSPSMDALSFAGIKRANFLGRMLVETGVTQAFCSDARRTRETLEPLKAALGDRLAIRQIAIGAPGGSDAHVQNVVAAIESLVADAVVIVVSHSNTIGRIIDGLGGGSTPTIADNEFDKLFILIRPETGTKTLLQMRY